MGNQQERLLDLEFAGGIATGEGSFYIAAHRRPKRNFKLGLTPGFVLQMYDHETMRIVSEIMLRHGLEHGLYEHKRGSLDIIATGRPRSYAAASALLPYLTGEKRRAASKLMEFCEARFAAPRNAPYSEHELDLVRDLRGINGNKNGPKNSLTEESSETNTLDIVASVAT